MVMATHTARNMATVTATAMAMEPTAVADTDTMAVRKKIPKTFSSSHIIWL